MFGWIRYHFHLCLDLRWESLHTIDRLIPWWTQIWNHLWPWFFCRCSYPMKAVFGLVCRSLLIVGMPAWIPCWISLRVFSIQGFRVFAAGWDQRSVLPIRTPAATLSNWIAWLEWLSQLSRPFYIYQDSFLSPRYASQYIALYCQHYYRPSPWTNL